MQKKNTYKLAVFDIFQLAFTSYVLNTYLPLFTLQLHELLQI